MIMPKKSAVKKETEQKATKKAVGQEKPKKGISKKLTALIAVMSAVVIGGLVVGGLWLGGVFDKGPAIYDSSNRYSVHAVDNDTRLDYSYTDGAFDYYYLYLGKVDFVPISSEGTKYYNGQTPISLSYSSATVTEQHIEEQNSLCITNTTQSQITSRHETSVKSSTEIGASFMVASVKQSLEIGYTYAKESQQQHGYSNSTTKTYTSFRSWQQTNSETISYTIGGHGERAGFYRYALFTTCDMYVTIVKDKMDGIYYYEFSSFARPDTFFTAIDYSPTNTFAARDGIVKLEFVSDIIDTLPAPTNENTDETVVYDYSLRTNAEIGAVTIPATIKQAIFIGSSTVFKMNVVILPRNTDLKIVMNNMKFKAESSGVGTHGIADTGVANKHTVYIALYGDNSITGGIGKKGKNYSADGGTYSSSAQFAVDLRNATNDYARENGMIGGEGYAGIALSANNLTIYGSGRLSVTGGTGGTSGVIPTVLWSTSTGGHKTDDQGFWGSDGGAGIECGSLSFADALGQNITITGGFGGKGADLGPFTDLSVFKVNVNPFTGRDGGAGGNALKLSSGSTFTQPSTTPVTLIGGAGGAGGSGKTDGQNRDDGDRGANGQRGDGN